MIGAWRNYRGDASSFFRCLWFTLVYSLQLAVGCLVFGRKVLLLFLMESWLREIDDVLDVYGRTTSFGLLQDKQSLLVRDQIDPSCDDCGIIAIVRCAESLGIDVRGRLSDVLDLMERELLLRRHPAVNRFQREYFAQMQDIAVLKLIAQVFGGDLLEVDRQVMELRGLLTRTDWLNDLLDDIKNGCFLLPEELARQGITLDQLSSAKSWQELWSIPGFLEWYSREAVDLGATWKTVHLVFRKECEAIFPRKIDAKFFYWSIFKELEGEFRQASKRCPAAA